MLTSNRWISSLLWFFTVSNGTRQGGILSQYLVSSYIRDLLYEVVESRYGCCIGGVTICWRWLCPFRRIPIPENPCHLLIFLKRKCRWRQTKLTLTVTLTLTDTVTVIFFTRISLTLIKKLYRINERNKKNENDGKKSLHGIRRNGTPLTI